MTSKYPYLNNVSPYQGYSSLNARERDYIISRYQQLLQKSRPKPPSILDDPSYAYYSAIARTGIDPITGKKVSPAEIANAKLQMNVLAVAPIVQSVVAGWAFGKQQNPGTKSQKPSSGNNTNTDLDDPPVQKPKSTEPGNPYQGLSDQKIADGFVKGLDDITKSGSLAKNYQASGGYEQALKDFKSLNLKNVKDISTAGGMGKVGSLPDGTKVVVRPISKDGIPTLEFQFRIPYKIRY